MDVGYVHLHLFILRALLSKATYNCYVRGRTP